MPSLTKEVSLGYWKLRFQVTENSTSVANNTSNVGYSATLISTGGTAQYNGAGEIHIYINGAHVLAKAVNINVMTNGGSQSLGSGTTTVGHDADGSKNVSVSATYKQVGTAYYLPKGGTVSGTLKLTDIPRATDITVDISNGTTLGNSITIKGTPNVSSFSHKIAYSLNNGDPVDIKTIDSGATSISEAWAIPTSLASSITESDLATLNLILYTYNGSTLIGSKQTSITVKIPESYVPTIGTISISEAVSSIASKFGKYVAEKSQLKFNISASGSNGSAIASCTTNIDKKSYTGQSFTTDVINGPLTNSDTIDIEYTVTVTDSRGRTASKTGAVSILTYYKPMFSMFSVQRANSSYTVDENSGTYALFRYTYDISKLDNKNTASMIIKYKATDAASWTTLNTVTSSPYTAINTEYHGGNIFDATKEYEVMIGLKDYFMSDYIYAYAHVNSTYTLINWANSGKAMSLFKQSDLNLSGSETDAVKSAYENWFEVHGDSYFSEMPNVMEDSSKTSSEISAHNTKLNNANKGTPLDKYILNKFHPIGCLYLSTNNVNPGDLFGGSWVSYGEGRVLIGAGTGTDANGKQMTFTAGATGGEYSHQLTVNEMPSHNHSPSSTGKVQVANLGGGSYVVADLSQKGNTNWAYKTASTGGNQSHNNMMPYIGGYIWRRVA
ncbi:DUF859 family phage minor structural protein [Absicoccus intestinalis]|uniref:DUF859 family phage minor structural protein n=1 Tax=Absicoccus intestinalis TaxID=2926319 RepID=A0ABU4WNN3_9FIRM|nr:DUF859 family phage minor structural protein [Absicoccus sp. CLA-KB-P134]MDX8417358.1 DUF859 family phage minor structural protein [Absicoccus sp. CLA-KB-P134]